MYDETGVCARKPNGELCVGDSECASGHCDADGAGICCDQGGSGVCCRNERGCDELNADSESVCTNWETCTGSREVYACDPDANVCLSEVVEDDTGCGTSQSASTCGNFQDTTCTGELTQEAPLCAETCMVDGSPDHALCDEGHHCNNGACEPDKMDGQACTESYECDAGECASNGICCAPGETCCQTPADCPDGFSTEVSCLEPQTCQGGGSVATCVEGRCGSTMIEDDSACDANARTVSCTNAPDVSCTGEISQPEEAPACPSCQINADCGDGYACNRATGACVVPFSDGFQCTHSEECESGHCQNGYCCDGGDCCNGPSTCPDPYGREASCQNPSQCIGDRIDATCEQNICGSRTVPDAVACGDVCVPEGVWDRDNWDEVKWAP